MFYSSARKRTLLAAGLMLTTGCHGAVVVQDKLTAAARADPAQLERWVERLEGEIVPRDYFHPEQMDRAAHLILSEFREATPHVAEHVFEVTDTSTGPARGTKRPFRNLIATFGPQTAERIIVGAHYDAAGDFPGADDNASGVAGLLALGRLLAQRPPALRVELVAFALEEPPYSRQPSTGSGAYAQKLKEGGVRLRAMIALEMIGYFSDAKSSQEYFPPLGLFYPSKGDFIAVVGKSLDGGLTTKITRSMRAADTIKIVRFQGPRWLPGVRWSDHNNFWERGYPALMITNTAFFRNKNYHTARDTPDTLDYVRMAAVVNALHQAVQDLAAGSVVKTAASRPKESKDQELTDDR